MDDNQKVGHGRFDPYPGKLEKTGLEGITTQAKEISRLRNRLAQIERQVIYRTADMPKWADKWVKNEHGAWFCGLTRSGHAYGTPAPDYRPDEPGPLWLPIIDAPDAGKGD